MPSTQPPAPLPTSPWQPIGPAKYYVHAGWADGRGELLLAGQMGLLRSTDDGTTLAKVKPLKRPFFTAVCRAADGAIYLGDTKGALQTSRDDGATWVMSKFPGIARVNALLATERQTLALSAGRVFRWAPGGEDWFEEKPAPKHGNSWHFALFGSERGQLYIVGGHQPSNTGGYLLTSDDGHVWSELPLPPKAPILTCGVAAGPVLCLAGYGHQMLRSEDRGASWIVRELPEKVTRISAVWTQGPLVVCCADQYIFRSEDGGERWALSFTNVESYWSLDVLFGSVRGYLYAIGTQATFRCSEPAASAMPKAPVVRALATETTSVSTAPTRARTPWDDRLDQLLEAWRSTRDPDLANLIDRVAKKVEPMHAAELSHLGGDTLQLAWLKAVEHATPSDVAALCATVRTGHLPEIEQRMHALARLPDDPRLAASAAAWVEACPFGSTSSKPCWTVAFKLLERCADARTLPVVQAARKRGMSITGKTMAGWMDGALDRLVSKLPKEIQAARKPLGPEQVALRAEIEGQL